MHTLRMQATLGLALLLADTVRTKAVFAHYMVNFIDEDHAQQDIDDAIAMGLDGFALNIGDSTQSFVNTTLGYLFNFAAGKSFKLFISMDLSAATAACTSLKTSCNGPYDYYDIFSYYLGNTAYYVGPNGDPVISTYSAGGLNNINWTDWKNTLDSVMYFIPDFDDTDGYYQAASGWWSYWGDVVDGLFSWEAAWPPSGSLSGTYPGDVSPDLPVIKGTVAHDKGYMIALSSLQYKDSYGGNYYRAGDLNLPTRMQNILTMSPQPDFVEIITWNDGPESHYIGTIWPEQNTNPAAGIYANQSSWPHNAWEPLIAPFINTWKAGGTASSMAPPSGDTAVGLMWYKTISQNETCPGTQPTGWDEGTDSLNWAIVLAAGSSGMRISAISNGVVIDNVGVNPGLNMGSATGLQYGAQMLQLLDSGGNVVMSTGQGACVSSDCPDGIYNMNLQVIGLVEGNQGNVGCFDI